MQEIKCPKCGEVFQVDESGYSAIVQQVRDKEFSKELKSREVQFELEKDNAVQLAKLAIEKANPDAGLPSFSERMAALEKRVSKLEGNLSSGGNSGSSDWPEWVQPTGAHNAYAKGSQVTHNGERYVSQIDANVWEPGMFGSESLWTKQA